MSAAITRTDEIAGVLTFLKKYNGYMLPYIWTCSVAAKRLNELGWNVDETVIQRAVCGGALAHYGIHPVDARGRSAFVVIDETAEQYTQIGASISTAHHFAQGDPPAIVAGDKEGAQRAQRAHERSKQQASAHSAAAQRSSPRQRILCLLPSNKIAFNQVVSI